MANPRKEKTEVMRIRESDADKLRQLQVKRSLKCLADAVTLMAQQYSIRMNDGHLVGSKHTLESVENELKVLAQGDPRFVGWKGSVVEEVTDGEWTIESKLGSTVTIRDGMAIESVLLSA